jgi:hypothetical protein
VQLDVTTAIRLPQDATDFVVTRDSLLAIVENLQITNGIIRIKTSNGAWTEQNISEITDLVLPFGNETSSLEIEVLAEGSDTPIAYSVPLSSENSSNPWKMQIAVIIFGAAALWFLIYTVRRRRKNEA